MQFGPKLMYIYGRKQLLDSLSMSLYNTYKRVTRILRAQDEQTPISIISLCLNPQRFTQILGGGHLPLEFNGIE